MQASRQRAFEAMADATRRKILQFLADRSEVTVGEIVEQFDSIGRTAISNHLRVLRSADLVVERRAGRFRHYSLSAEGPVHEALAFLQDIVQAAVPRVAQADPEVEVAGPSDRLRARGA